MVLLSIAFPSSTAANQLIAGVPAVARIARSAAIAAGDRPVELVVLVPGGAIDSTSLTETSRLAPRLGVSVLDANFSLDRALSPRADAVFVNGAALPDADAIEDVLTGRVSQSCSVSRDPAAAENWLRGDAVALAGAHRALRHAGAEIIRATAKPTDGIVSRYCNRPISQRLTSLMLHFRWARPWHATLLCALAALAMMACLLLGGPGGLIAGAVLFQVASVIDGVDGEMARATFRSSARGAMLDSLTDAATNLGFLAGLAFNLWQQGYADAAWAGVVCFLGLAVGLALIATRVRASSDPFTFDAVKIALQNRGGWLGQALIWMTMRDFFAAASAIMVLAGFGMPLLMIFTVVILAWLVVVFVVLLVLRPASAAVQHASSGMPLGAQPDVARSGKINGGGVHYRRGSQRP